MKDKSDFTLICLLKHLVFKNNIKINFFGGIKMENTQKTNQQTSSLKNRRMVYWNKNKMIPSLQVTLKFWEADKNE